MYQLALNDSSTIIMVLEIKANFFFNLRLSFDIQDLMLELMYLS